MFPISTLLTHGLLYGALLSGLLSLMIVLTLLYRPMVWLNDAPPELRAAAGPISPADRRFQRLAGAALLGLMVIVPIVALVTLRSPAGGSLTFRDAALTVFIVLMTFNTVDLLLLDWLLVERLLPGRIAFPGAPDIPFTRGDAHHFRGFLIGTGLSLAAAVVFGAVAALLM